MNFRLRPTDWPRAVVDFIVLFEISANYTFVIQEKALRLPLLIV